MHQHPVSSSLNIVRAIAAVAIVLVLKPMIASADLKDTVAFDVPAQQLPSALNRYAEQAGVQVTSPGQLIEGKTSSAVSGRLGARAALDLLLKDTQLRFDVIDDKTVVIMPAATSAADAGANLHNSRVGQENSSGLRLAQNSQTGSTSSPGEQNSTGPEGTKNPSLQKGGVEEIIVTATKREERLLDVPVSIGVVTSEDIDRRGLVSGEDYLRGIPGVAQGGNGMYGDSIVIRGIETTRQGQNLRTGNTVATYFGETPTTSSRGLTGGTNIDLKLVDIERVEVLRGPQGTAFGNSAIGGAVRTIPVAPKLDRFEGKLATGYSQTSGTGGDNNMIQGVGNFPLIQDRLALRVVAYRFDDSGYYRNVARSNAAFQSTIVIPQGQQAIARDEDDIGATRFIGGRASLLFQASDNLKFTLSYLKQDIEQDGFPAQTSGLYEQTVLQVAPEHQYRGQSGATNDADIDITNATIGYDFGWSDLLATYSYSSSGSIPVFPFTGLNNLNLNAPVSASPVNKQRAHFGEIRLTTKLDGAWNFLGGVYTEDLDDKSLYTYWWPGDPSTEPAGYPGTRFIAASDGWRNLKQKAVFAEASWKFLPRFTLTAGARYYDYERNGGDVSNGSVFVGNSSTSIHNDATGTTFRGNLSYKPMEDALVYASWAQGFRLGAALPGVQASTGCDANGDGIVDGTTLSFASTRATESDEVNNYEIGSKVALLDRRMNLTAAAFRMDWINVPVSLLQPPGVPSTCPAFIYTANAGEARSEGAELQANFHLTKGLSVDVGGSWVRARITKVASNIQVSSGVVVGARLPTPEYNGNLGVQYEFGVGNSAAFVRLDSTYVGSFFDNVNRLPTNQAGGYTKMDARARVAFINHLSVDVFVQNLTNQDDYTFRGTRPFGAVFGYRLQPRTIGVQLGYTFQ